MRIVGLRLSSAQSCQVLDRATVLPRQATSMLSVAKHGERLLDSNSSTRVSLSFRDLVSPWYSSCNVFAGKTPAVADSKQPAITCSLVLGALDVSGTGRAFVVLRFATPPSTNRYCLPTPLHLMFFLRHLAHSGVPASHRIRRRTH